MVLAETGHSTKQVSFAQLVAGEAPVAQSSGFSFVDLTERLVVGGWPGFQSLSPAAASANLADYLDTLAHVDVQAVDGVPRDPIRVRLLLSALARSTATEITISALGRDVASLARDTVRDYLAVLERGFITEDQPAWSAHLRSSATLRQAPKRHLADPSLAAAALGANPAALQRDPAFTGQLFESLAVHHLRVYAQASRGVVTHARDSAGGEVDAIVQFPTGAWAAFEMKLGTARETIDAAARSLLAFAANVADDRVPVLTVITPGGPSYRRPDGVNVLALAALTQ
jgi:predicted AAA+ superfamily ATPase